MRTVIGAGLAAMLYLLGWALSALGAAMSRPVAGDPSLAALSPTTGLGVVGLGILLFAAGTAVLIWLLELELPRRGWVAALAGSAVLGALLNYGSLAAVLRTMRGG